MESAGSGGKREYDELRVRERGWTMRGVCFCSRGGEIAEREPILDDARRRALRCPDEACIHTGHLDRLSEADGFALWSEARNRREVLVAY
jgi:hypothetical protein